MTLVCPNCNQTRTLTLQEQRGIIEELAGQMPAVRKIITCVCGLTDWALALRDVKPAARPQQKGCVAQLAAESERQP